MIKIIAVLFSVLSLFGSQVFADYSGDNTGTAAAQFLKIGAGARAGAMGDTGGALGDDSTAIYWNPACLAELTQRSLNITHMQWFDGIFYDWASCAVPFGLKNTAGIGIQYLNYGDIPHLDNTGTANGTFSPHDCAVTFSCARRFGIWSAGIGAKYIQLSPVDTAATYAFDAGVLVYLVPGTFTAGLSAHNIGPAIKFNTAEERLPSIIRLSFAAYPLHRLVIAADIDTPSDNEPVFHGGGEYLIPCFKNVTFALRGGYSTQGKYLDGLATVTAGAGISLGMFDLDYAYVPFGQFDTKHYFSLRVSF